MANDSKETRRTRRPLAWLAGLAAVGLLLLLLVNLRGPQVDTIVVQRQDLEQRLLASGRVWVPSRVQVAAVSTGRVLSVGVREGQAVEQGDLLVQLEDTELRAAANRAQAAVEQAQARIDQLGRAGVVSSAEAVVKARSGLERSRLDLEHTRTLADSGYASADALDAARRETLLAEARLASALADQQSTTPEGADMRILQSGLEQALAERAAAVERLAQTRLLAPAGGRVLTRSVEPGDVVQPARTLLVLAAGSEPPALVFQTDERNLAALKVGQPARASADAWPDSLFDAVVEYIAPAVDAGRGSVEVRLSLPSVPPWLMPDMTVSIDLALDQRKAVLTLPTDALHEAATPRPWVQVLDRGRVRRQSLQLGLHGSGHVEILAGVAEGDVVIQPGPRLLDEHQRAHAGDR